MQPGLTALTLLPPFYLPLEAQGLLLSLSHLLVITQVNSALLSMLFPHAANDGFCRAFPTITSSYSGLSHTLSMLFPLDAFLSKHHF